MFEEFISANVSRLMKGVFFCLKKHYNKHFKLIKIVPSPSSPSTSLLSCVFTLALSCAEKMKLINLKCKILPNNLYNTCKHGNEIWNFSSHVQLAISLVPRAHL